MDVSDDGRHANHENQSEPCGQPTHSHAQRAFPVQQPGEKYFTDREKHDTDDCVVARQQQLGDFLNLGFFFRKLDGANV